MNKNPVLTVEEFIEKTKPVRMKFVGLTSIPGTPEGETFWYPFEQEKDDILIIGDTIKEMSTGQGFVCVGAKAPTYFINWMELRRFPGGPTESVDGRTRNLEFERWLIPM